VAGGGESGAGSPVPFPELPATTIRPSGCTDHGSWSNGWAPEGLDARFSATGRTYMYRVNTGAVPDPFRARFEWHRPGGLSVGAMRRAAAALTGEHDFASFCRAPKDEGSTVRDLRRLAVGREGDRFELPAYIVGQPAGSDSALLRWRHSRPRRRLWRGWPLCF